MVVWFCFFFNDTATTEIYTLSLHDALPISGRRLPTVRRTGPARTDCRRQSVLRSEEHTSELQSHLNLVCRLLLEKKKMSIQCTMNQKPPWAARSAVHLLTNDSTSHALFSPR